jgi:uncharacterized SAM-binding protein YcdF (DUF218 family)
MSPVVALKSRRSRIIAAVATALVLTLVALTLRLFVYPDLNPPVHSNAIVVLGGFGLNSVHEGEKLAQEGYASTLVFSLEPSVSCVPSTAKVRIMCFRANPLSTRGEARAIAALARKHHWHRIIVVMPTTQATRARLRIGRCYPGQLLEVGVAPSGVGEWLGAFAYEWAALIKALVWQTGC